MLTNARTYLSGRVGGNAGINPRYLVLVDGLKEYRDEPSVIRLK
jgi:hypothetical protein